jgi:hypothetical protein
MVTLRRVYTIEDSNSYLTLPSTDPYTLWQQSKDKLSQTKLISLKSLNLQNVRVRDPHTLDTLYINNTDADLLKKTIEEVREKQSDSLTLLTIAREIDHSIEDPSDFPVNNTGLFTTSQNDSMEFIPSYIVQGIKELKAKLLDLGIRLNINIVSHNNQSLNKAYHIEGNATKTTILKLSLKVNKKNYANRDVGSIKELKDFLIEALSGNQEAVNLIKNYDFTNSVSLPKAQQARILNGILYYSMAPSANNAHKIGQLDFSFSNEKVNIVPTAAKKYKYKFENGYLKEG